MKYLCIAWIIITIIIVAYLIGHLKHVDKLNQNVPNKIRNSKFVFYGSILGVLMINVLFPIVCLSIFADVPWEIGILYGVFMMLFMNPFWTYFLLLYFNWGIYVEDDALIYYNFFKQKKIYRFVDYSFLKVGNRLILASPHLAKNKKLKYKVQLRIPIFCQNLSFLIEKYYAYWDWLTEEYERTHPQSNDAN